MNKILMDGDKIILNKQISSIEVTGSAKIYINNIDFDLNLEINLNNDSKLEVYDFTRNKLNKNFNVYQENNTSFDYFHTF